MKVARSSEERLGQTDKAVAFFRRALADALVRVLDDADLQNDFEMVEMADCDCRN